MTRGYTLHKVCCPVNSPCPKPVPQTSGIVRHWERNVEFLQIKRQRFTIKFELPELVKRSSGNILYLSLLHTTVLLKPFS